MSVGTYIYTANIDLYIRIYNHIYIRTKIHNITAYVHIHINASTSPPIAIAKSLGSLSKTYLELLSSHAQFTVFSAPLLSQRRSVSQNGPLGTDMLRNYLGLIWLV